MTKFKNTAELEKAYFELEKEFTKKCQERAELEKVVKLQKTVNDALIEENLDYSYDITDLAYERAKEMAKCWECGYQEEIKDLKKALKLACERVKYFEEMQDREMGHFEFFGYENEYDLQAIIKKYIDKAKELKDE